MNDRGTRALWPHAQRRFRFRASLLGVLAAVAVGFGLAARAPVASGAPAQLNPLAYFPPPTDGDPLQHVRWYVFGADSPAGRAAVAYSAANPTWAAALDTLAQTPGSLSHRFWMWNEPIGSVARIVRAYLDQAQRQQPGTTVALNTYSLIHGSCLDPASIRRHFERWVTQLARGIGTHRVVLYLEEDSLLETHCLTPAQVRIRERELAFAVRQLSHDPHTLVYLDAGAPDAYQTPRQMAALLRASDVAQAAGFAVNATHHVWTTAAIWYGQRIARILGGEHFIVNTSSNGQGPYLNRHPRTQGVELLCNPPGMGLGPLTWNTGYRYLDALLWYNNPGFSDGSCGRGNPPTGTFWPAYAVALVQHRNPQITGPFYHLLRSRTDT